MSILIHGMKMPKDGCKSCAFDIYGSCLIRANMDKPYEVTHSCPLIELPPHGRLIDVSKLPFDDVRLDEFGDWRMAVEDIEDAPTIIPAEGGGADE